VGSIGHFGAWSFCQDKIMTTGGEGGMLTTNRRDWWSAAWSYKDHGKAWEAVYERQHAPGFRWLHESFGTNWRMMEMQAAIGRIQLRRMDDWHSKRLINAEAIWSAARKLSGLRVPDVPVYVEHAAYKCYVFVDPDHLKYGWNRDRILNTLNERGIPSYSGSCSEVYLEKAFDGMSSRPAKRLQVAKQLGETSLMFLVHPTLTVEEIETTCRALREVMAEAAS
jgi:dTDP-4-amino-4,6-dideoxygalactose transaminase